MLYDVTTRRTLLAIFCLSVSVWIFFFGAIAGVIGHDLGPIPLQHGTRILSQIGNLSCFALVSLTNKTLHVVQKSSLGILGPIDHHMKIPTDAKLSLQADLKTRENGSRARAASALWGHDSPA